MPVQILMPALSPTMEEGTLAKWHVKEGDAITSGQVLAEIETDKATMEFEAVEEGVLGRIVVPEGSEHVKVNQPIAILLEEGESAEDAELDAAQPEAPKPASGQGAPAATEAAPAAAAPPAAGGPAPAAAAPEERIFASPLARRIAKERQLDLARIAGSGPRGRIVKADVEKAAAAPAAAEPAAAAPERPTAAPAPPRADADAVRRLYADRDFEEVRLDGMRRTVAARLSEAKATIPHFYLRREIRLDALLKLRGQLNAELEARGVKLSVNDFVIKASALALQRVPDCNVVWAGDRILRLRPSDVAVAVAIEGGLFTPVVRDAEVKTLSAISAEMKDLAARARARKLAPHEYQGGSFAISNLGMFGIENFDAVINPPHGSILAVGAGLRKPVVEPDGSFASATIMSATLSVDHRAIDGALGAAFLDAVRELLEHPLAMLA